MSNEISFLNNKEIKNGFVYKKKTLYVDVIICIVGLIICIVGFMIGFFLIPSVIKLIQ